MQKVVVLSHITHFQDTEIPNLHKLLVLCVVLRDAPLC